jgi:endonuclease III-like uncharacterized protein
MLLAAVNDKSKRNNLRAFEDEYARLRRLLLSNLPKSIDLVDETLQLLRLSAKIFRRFQQRSVALIKLLRFLDQESSTKGMDTRDEVRKQVMLHVSMRIFSAYHSNLVSFRRLLGYWKLLKKIFVAVVSGLL